MTRPVGISISLAVAAALLSPGIPANAPIPQSPAGGPVRAAAAAESSPKARIAYLKKHAIRVRSIDAGDGDFTDLAPLGEVIGGRRIVMLGECTHGDGAAFAAKSRLIKFLHERMGFDVLAFESGFYDTRRAWSALRSGEDPLQAVSSAVDQIWSASRQTQPLWRYVAEQSKTSHPLELSGFDMQFTGSASTEYLLKDLSAFLSKAGLAPDIAGAASLVTGALALMLEDPGYIQDGSPFKNVGPGSQAAVLIAGRALGEALGALRPSGEPERVERDYWIQLLKSNAALLEMSWGIKVESLEKADMTWASNLRDRQMGDNLIWLARRAYPTRKIIVWAGGSHIIRHHDLLANPDVPFVSMGDRIDATLGPEVYALGFSADRGRWGDVGMSEPRDVVPAAPDSLEGLLVSAGFEYALVDFRNPAADGAWLRTPFSCRPIRGHQDKRLIADWTRMMDGLFFIKEMFPSARVEKK